MKAFSGGRWVAMAMAAAAGPLLFAVAAQAQTGAPPANANIRAQQQMALIRTNLKQRYGLTDAQADAFFQKEQVIAMSSYQKATALQAKYGKTPTPSQTTKMEAEKVALISDMGKQSKAALLSVVAPAQRPRIERMLQIEAQSFRMRQQQLRQKLSSQQPQPPAKH